MFNLILALLYIYIFVSFCLALIVVSCLKYCNEYEVKDMFINAGLDHEDTIDLFKKANETFNKSPYLFFTISVVLAFPCLIGVWFNNLRGKKSK